MFDKEHRTLTILTAIGAQSASFRKLLYSFDLIRNCILKFSSSSFILFAAILVSRLPLLRPSHTFPVNQSHLSSTFPNFRPTAGLRREEQKTRGGLSMGG